MAFGEPTVSKKDDHVKREENIKTVKKIVSKNRRFAISEITENVDISAHAKKFCQMLEWNDENETCNNETCSENAKFWVNAMSH